MSLNFPKRNNNDAQWHFPAKNENRGYEPNDEEIPSDVLGSYTGTSYGDLQPEQDADDL